MNRYTESTGVFVLRNDNAERLLIGADPAELPPMNLPYTQSLDRVGDTFVDPSINQGRPSATAWGVCDAFCLSFLCGALAMMFSDPLRGWVLALLERLVLR